MKKKKASPRHSRKDRPREDAVLLPGAASLLSEDEEQGSEEQAALQRDLEPDDFDFGTDVQGDRVRGAGGQSLAELVIAKEQGWGLEEHGGGLRHDRPEPNVNDYDPDEDAAVEPEVLVRELRGGKSRIA